MTVPILQHYRGQCAVLGVDACQPIEAVRASLEECLGARASVSTAPVAQFFWTSLKLGKSLIQ